MSARVIMLNGEPHIISITRDISERKQYEAEHEITLNLLQSLHKEVGLNALIQDVTALMQHWSGCEAVGIRLREGKDYPYFETRGFPATFVTAERRLCAAGPDGQSLCDDTGDPILECMCGNVIQGRFDPALPFFTEKGSFWTNSTTDFLATTSEAERQSQTRNRCNDEGYESLALIPLSVGPQRIGLLQFNDRRRDRFDAERIALFERLASSLAIGLDQRITARALTESEAKYRSMMEAMEDPTFICAADLRIEYMNPAMIRLIGWDATGEHCHRAIHELDGMCPQCPLSKVMQGEAATIEMVLAKTQQIYNVSNSPVTHADGSVSMLTVMRDVTGTKNMEKRIQQAQRMESIGPSGPG